MEVGKFGRRQFGRATQGRVLRQNTAPFFCKPQVLLPPIFALANTTRANNTLANTKPYRKPANGPSPTDDQPEPVHRTGEISDSYELGSLMSGLTFLRLITLLAISRPNPR